MFWKFLTRNTSRSITPRSSTRRRRRWNTMWSRWVSTVKSESSRWLRSEGTGMELTNSEILTQLRALSAETWDWPTMTMRESLLSQGRNSRSERCSMRERNASEKTTESYHTIRMISRPSTPNGGRYLMRLSKLFPILRRPNHGLLLFFLIKTKTNIKTTTIS